ncbi:UPF0669 protein v1g209471-like [Patiria miniata]|uniref:Uncharacterized protein n=1 Tax=Patiria miniata TaxID=46514 RepID=A0A914BCA1_PATMI|nr:UPF0669 protein v1g209471-like [Patiria miniata]XP_038073465.1 UPF0669 protein v1g209471-like [Patiria miniata]
MRVKVSLPTNLLIVQVVFSLLEGCTCEVNVLLQTLTGSVPPGNYSYYKLTRGGNIRLVLRTLKGDADVYVSSTTLHPTYEDYDLKSTTYGEEIVDIAEMLNRPVGIGVYGHPLYQNDTSYEFDILLDTSEIEDPWRTENGKGEPSLGKLFAGEDAENESLLWKVFIGILKVAVDVMI